MALMRMKAVIGLTLAFGIGAVCRLADIPLPAPPAVVGAVLVLSMTLGYLLMNKLASHRLDRSRSHCGGPSGELPSSETRT